MNASDYKQLFEQSSELVVVMDTEFTILAASDSYLKVTKTTRENITGRDIFNVFPDNPNDISANGESKIRDSFNRVLKNKTADTLAVVKYDIPKPESEGGGFELKYWRPCHSPVLDEFNNVKYIVQRVEDVTENGGLVSKLELEKKTLKGIEDSEKRYNLMLMKSPFAFAVLKGKNKVITLANDRVKKIWAKGMDIEGKPLLEIMPELKDTPFPALLDEVYATGIPYHGIEVQSPKDSNGQLKDEYFNFVFQPYLEADETISGIAIIGYEVTTQVIVKKAFEQQREVERKLLKSVEDSEKRYNMILMKSPFGFAVLKGKSMVITLANDSIKEFWGKGKDVEGKPLFEVVPELNDSAFPGLLDKVYTTGVPFHGEELLAPFMRYGKLEDAYFNFVYQPYLEADETISGVTVIVYEVTAQVMVKKALAEQREVEKKALKRIEDSNKRYHMMLMESPFAFSIMKGKDMVVTLANDLMKEFWGKGKDVEGKTLLQVLPELKDQPFPELIDKVYTTGTPHYANEILAQLEHDGKMEDKYFNIVYQPHQEADDTISGVTTIAYEVTEMVLARKKVEESEQRYLTLIEEAYVATALYLGPEIRVQYANDIMVGYWGKDKAVLGKPLMEAVPELSGQPFLSYLEAVYASGKPYTGVEEKADLLINGKQQSFYFNFTYKALRDKEGNIYGIHHMAIDVTSEVLIKKALEASENRYKSLTKATTSVVWIADSKGYFLEPQPSWQEYTGQPWEEHQGFGWTNMIQEDDRQKIIQLWRNALEQKSDFHASGKIWSKKHNAYRYFESSGIPLLDEQENIIEWVGMITDVHEQRTAGEKIEESENRYHEMVYSSPSLIAIFKGEDMIISIANDPVLESWGKGKEIIGKSLFTALPEIIDQGFEKILLNVYKTGTPFHAYEMPVSFIRHGKWQLMHYTFVYQPQRNVNGEIEGVAVIANEVTSQALLNKKIKASEERFRLLVQQAPVAICVLRGVDYVIETINEGMVEMWGRKMEETLNKPAFDVLPEFRDQGLKELLDNVYNTGERLVSQELALNIRRNGKFENIFVKFVYEPLRESDGMISGVMALAHEITEQVVARKRIEESEKQFRLLTNAMPQKISTADAAGNVTFYNQQWIDDTGYTFEELKGWGWEKVMHPEDLDRTKKSWQQSVATGNLFDVECRILNTKGEFKWHLSRALPVKDEDGKIKMWVGSNTDIHLQKEQKEELEKAVVSRTRQLVQKNAELENANKELTSFTYVSSHDLQEPLRKLQNFASFIMLEEEKNLSETGKGYFLRMRQIAQRMQELIEDLLEYSRAKSGERRIENIDLNLLWKDVIADFEEVIHEKKAILEAIALCHVKIMPLPFRQVFQNLVSNAFKFSKPDVPPHLIIKSEIAMGRGLNKKWMKNRKETLLPQIKYCHITFSDNGIGFDPQYKDRIFEVFQRLHTFEEYGGTGIGLAICKRIIENHNGFITATAKLGRGAQFDIFIPAN